MSDLMKQPENRNIRRLGIIINLIALSYIVITWAINPGEKTRMGLLLSGGFALLILLFTYYYSFWRTNLWTYTHKRINMLDERELAENNRALRFAYSVFTVIVLIILLYFVLSTAVLSIIPVAGMIYLAHILPAVYLGWIKK